MQFMPKSNSLFLSLLFDYVFSFPKLIHIQEKRPKTNHLKAYIILKDSSKVEGYIQRRDDHNYYQSIKFISLEGNRQQYSPSWLIEFYLVNRSKTFISFGNIFMEGVFEGDSIQLFRYIKSSNLPVMGPAGGTFYTPIEKTKFFIRANKQDPLLEVKSKKFKEKFSKFFNKCPTISEKILSGEYKRRDIEWIVREYEYCMIE